MDLIRSQPGKAPRVFRRVHHSQITTKHVLVVDLYVSTEDDIFGINSVGPSLELPVDDVTHFEHRTEVRTRLGLLGFYGPEDADKYLWTVVND